MTAPWLSILLPVYRVEPYLLACAASILDQADAGVELVFVDDASPDGSAALVESLQARDPRVRLLRHAHNQGVSAARNTLLDAARGDYLWFVDPDDLMEPGALARLKAVLAQQAPDLVMCDFRAFDDGSSKPAKPRYQHIPSFIGAAQGEDLDGLLSGLFQAGQLHPWSKIVRRAIWPAGLRFPVGRVFEDLAVYPRLALQVRRFVHAPEVWIAYRQRAGSALANLSAARLDEWMGALEGYAAELPTLSEGTRFEIAHFCARTFVRACKRRSRLGQQGLSEALRRFARQWRASSPLSPEQLLRAYLQRGKWLRWLQLRWWLSKAS
ncbi:glycosyltransferase family 2 protein [Paucibacter soli]|uniref:glycosyltransferase family 2 protein n=1 Tax=Paucibacter soli TaxID=3133433 RepID=UPI0030B2708A